MNVALRTVDLVKHFGGLRAVNSVSLALPQGARHAVIGPNGAGKTSLINLLTGVLRPSSGEVFLGEERVTRLPVHQRVKRGLVRTFQINNLFPELTVLQSVLLAVCERRGVAVSPWRPVAACGEEIAGAQEVGEAGCQESRRPRSRGC